MPAATFSMTPDPQKSGQPEEASRWVARRNAGLTPAECAELQAWLKADPRHAVALARADPQASELDWPLHAGALDRVLTGLEVRATRRRRHRRRLAAGSLAGLMLLAAVLPLAWSPGNSPTTALVIRSPEQRLLPDGSRIELEAGAEVRIAFAPEARRVELVRGAAHFTVQKNAARPFLVSAGGVTARAVGTAFLVGLEPGQVALVVTEGRVAVDRAESAAVAAPSTLALVQAGESVAVEDAAAGAPTPPRITALPVADQQRRLAWRIPRLEFNGTSLGEIVAVMNRHNRTQLALAERELGDLKLSGALSADRVDALVEMLEADFRLVAERAGDRLTLRRGSR